LGQRLRRELKTADGPARSSNARSEAGPTRRGDLRSVPGAEGPGSSEAQ
jgi:hypothetical protein